MTPKQSWVLKAAIIVVAALVGVVLGSLAMCYYYDLSFVEVWFEWLPQIVNGDQKK